MKATIKPAPHISEIAQLIPKSKKTMVDIALVIEGQQIDIKVKPTLSLSEYSSFANHVAEHVFIEETNEETGRTETVYAPHFKGIDTVRAILAFYTNISLDADAETLFYIINNTDIISQIIEVVNKEQLDDLMRDTLLLIESRKSRLENKSPLTDIVDLFSIMTGGIEEKLKDPEFLRGYIDEAIADELSKDNG